MKSKRSNYLRKIFLIKFFIFSFFSIEVLSQESQLSVANDYKGYNLSLKHGIMSNFINTKSNFHNSGKSDINALSTDDLIYDFHGKLGNSMNVARAQCSDSFGNIYITGSSGNANTNSGDIAVVKINTNGTIEWTLNIPSPEFTVNSGTAISIDSNGFLYIVGYIWNQTSMDVFCSKITNDGQIVWQTINGSTDSFEVPNSLVVSNDGEVFIAGITHLNHKVTYYVSKIGSNGVLIWNYVDASFPSQTWNEPKLIRQDNNGDVVVCGFGYDESSKSKTVISKFTTNGVLLWKHLKSFHIFENTEILDTDGFPVDFTFDTDNNIYIINNFSEEIFLQSSTLKYDSNGQEDWNVTHQFDEASHTVVKQIIINQNKILVGGYKYGNQEDGFVLYAMNLDGSFTWSQNSSDQYAPSNFNMSVVGDEIFVDSIFMDMDSFGSIIKSSTYNVENGSLMTSGNLVLNTVELGFSINSFFKSLYTSETKTFIFCSTYPTLGTVYEVLKTNNFNSVIWNTKFTSQNSIRLNVMETVSDSDSNTYSVVSTFYVSDANVQQINEKSYLLKYNSDGNLIASVLILDSPGVSTNRLITDNNNDLILFTREDQSEEVTLTKFSNNLNQLWSSSFVLNSLQPETLSIDNLNNIYLITAVPSENNPTHSNIKVIKYSSNGLLVFSTAYYPENVSLVRSFVSNVIYDGLNSFFIGGISFNGLDSNFNEVYSPVVLNILTDGSINYYQDYPLNSSASYVELSKINEDLYIAANATNDQTGLMGVFLLKINSQGQLIWQSSDNFDDEELYLKKFLFSSSSSKLFTICSKIGSTSNIHITSWDLNGNLTGFYTMEPDNYYQDAFLDNEQIFVLSQNQVALHFPYRLLNWNGPFISSKVTKLGFDLVVDETIDFFGTNYSLYEPKQFVPLANSSLLISGRLFHEELFFEGLKFFSISYQPVLGVPEVPTIADKQFYCSPNPTSENQTSIYVYLPNSVDAKINIYDVSGKLVKEIANSNFDQGLNILLLETSTLNRGVYILKLITDETTLATKLLVN